MRALRWIFMAAAVFLALASLAIAIGVMWLNTFVHSEAFKQEIETRAGQSLGGAVQIDKIAFGLFSGVKLEGFVTHLDLNQERNPNAFQVRIESVDFAYSWSALLQRQLKLTGVTLFQPQFVLTRQPYAPSLTPPPEPNPATPGGMVTGTLPGPAGTALPFQFIVDRAKVKDGSISVRDTTGASMVELQGIDVTADLSKYNLADNATGEMTGTIRISRAALPSRALAADFSTPFTWRPGTISATPFGAAAFGGKIAGGYQLGNVGPSILDLNARDCDVAQLTAATASNSSAQLSGSLNVQSKWRGIETGDLNGEGDAQLVNGRLEGVKILQELSQILKVKELEAPIIRKAQTHFVAQNRQIKFIGLQLASTIFLITGDGTIGFDGEMNANLVLILTREAMARLPGPIAASFVQKQDGTGSIAFQVTGTTSNPKTDLPERLLMQNTEIKNVISKALMKFFH